MPAPPLGQSLLLLLAAQGALALRRDGPAAHADTVEGSAATGCSGLPLPADAFDRHLATARLYSLPGSQGGHAIITYAGSTKQAYIDGAVMLGRSLARLDLPVELWCLVQATMAPQDRQRLEAVGWRLREVEPWLPEEWHKERCGYWHDAYNKVDIFRLPFDRVLYLDADTFVFGHGSDLLQLLNGELKPGEIKMVKDVNGHSYNSGVMVFSPDLEAFRKVQSVMATGQLDQPSINKAYDGAVAKLPFRYNVHGFGKHNCSDVVIAHFTGVHKPAEANAKNLKLIRGGAEGLQYGLSCPNLYIEYFKELHRQYDFLSPPLKKLLSQPDFGPATAGLRDPEVPAPAPARRREPSKAEEAK
mmetsp:Transcript_110820/g.324224  ORF Transcript_110820/g.324224 Transcript_110820/m.324224 type:complete len:359 (-) Transcript_110820:83-1159(-)